MSAEPAPQRRAHPRHDLRLSAELTVAGRTFTATTRNLSVGGCCLESVYSLPESQQLVVKLFMVVDGIEDETFPPLEARAEVQWTAPSDAGSYLAGVRFELTGAQAQWLEQFLARTGDK